MSDSNKNEKLIENLKNRNFTVEHVKTRKEAKDIILKLIPKSSVVGYGGSVSVEQTGILEHFRNSMDYDLLDKANAITPTEKNQLAHESFEADYYLSSVNALTTDGLLVNVDATSNRVAALSYGPKKVIFVIGKNKIVDNLDQALDRIKNGVVKRNAERLDWDTPCRHTDKCLDCRSEKRMCCTTVIHEYSSFKGRIKVILVDEELGY
jgi:hypothetical protein